VAALEAVARLREGPTGSARDYVVVIERDGEGVVLEEMTVDERPVGAERAHQEEPLATDAPRDAHEPADEDAPPDADEDAAQDAAEPLPADVPPPADEPPSADDHLPADDGREAVARGAGDHEPAPESVRVPDAADAHEAADDAEEVDEDERASAEEPREAARQVHQVVVPARYVPSEVTRGLHDPAGRALPGSERIPEELIRDWERKIARLEGRPPPDEESGGEAETERGGG
jgi:hypothetical protein